VAHFDGGALRRDPQVAGDSRRAAGLPVDDREEERIFAEAMLLDPSAQAALGAERAIRQVSPDNVFGVRRERRQEATRRLSAIGDGTLLVAAKTARGQCRDDGAPGESKPI